MKISIYCCGMKASGFVNVQPRSDGKIVVSEELLSQIFFEKTGLRIARGMTYSFGV